MEGFQYGDIIVIGAIAAFIILRYRAMLGNQEGRDPTEIQRPSTLAEYEHVVKVTERETQKPKIEQVIELESSYPEPLAESLRQIRAIDPDFTPDEFLNGAKMAFEMIIKAFNDHDHETLKMLLAKDVYENFKEVMDAQVAQNIRQETTLVAIKNATITQVQLHRKTARISVTFDSEQIHLMRDASGTITQGNPSDVDLMDDAWIFERDVSSSNPNWLVIET